MMSELDEKVLLQILDMESYAAFQPFIADKTPNQLVAFQSKHAHDNFDHMLWTVSVTWGFEVLWAQQYSLLKEERHPEIDLPKFDQLTPDTPLGQHTMWAPQDQLIRLQS